MITYIKQSGSYRVSFLIFFPVCFLFLPLTRLSGQTQKNWQWVRQLGGDSWDVSSGIVCDSKNNLFVTGSFFNTLKSGSKEIVSDGYQDIFISKFNQNGSLENIWSAGGSGVDNATAICLLPDDKILIGGSVSDTAKFGKLKTYGPGKKLYITKLDGEGLFTWVTEMTINGEASLNFAGVDRSGMIFASGVYSGSLTSGEIEITSKGKKDVFLARLNSLGSIEKLVSFGSQEDESLSSMAVNDSGSVVITGSYISDPGFGSLKPLSGHGITGINVFIVKLDEEFDPVWASTLRGDEYCEVKSMKFDRENNILASGNFSSRLFVEDTVLKSNGFSDIFLIKFKPDGKTEWKRNFGSGYYDYAAELNIDNLDGIVISGTVGDTLLIDSLRVEPLVENSAFVIQFSQGGKATWTDCISGSGRNFSSGSALDRWGNLYFTGSFKNEFKRENEVLTSAGDQDIFIAKYFNCIEKEAEISGLRYFCPGTGTELSVRRIYSNVVWNDTIAGKYSINVTKSGTYSVKMLDSKGCLLEGKVDIVQSREPWFTLGPDTTILKSDSLILRAPESYSVESWNDLSYDKEFIAKSVDGKPGKKEYWLTVRDSLDCIFTDTIAVSFINENALPNTINTVLKAYPNPAIDKIWWSLETDEVRSFNLDLTDERGIKMIHQVINRYNPGEQREMYIGNLPSGIYYLKITDSTPANSRLLRIVKK